MQTQKVPIASHPPRKGAWVFKHPPPQFAGKSKCDNQPHIKSKPGCPDKTSGVLPSNIKCLGTDVNLSTGNNYFENWLTDCAWYAKIQIPPPS